MNNLQAHYKAVRARMGMVPKPNLVAISRPGLQKPEDTEGEHAVEVELADGEGILSAERDELQALIHMRLTRFPTPPLSMKACYLATAQHFGVTTAEMLGPSRAMRFTVPRQIGFYLARELTGNSWGMVGQYAGRDHTSIMHGWQKIDRLLRVGSKDICLAVAAIKERLEP